jgi:hypothetical protein
MYKQLFGKPMFDLTQSDSIQQVENFNPFYCARSEPRDYHHIQAENQRKKDDAINDAKAKIETTVNVDSNNVSAETFNDKSGVSELAPAGLATRDFQTDRASALTHLAERPPPAPLTMYETDPDPHRLNGR